MKEFKGYQTHNEAREDIINKLNIFFSAMNKIKPNSGDIEEMKIADKHDVVALSELSTGTLINEYNRLNRS